jgi:signal transduction histidine kinase
MIVTRHIRKLQCKEETLRATRPLKALTEFHQALMRAAQEETLLHEACRVIVEVGGYPLAWVGYAEDELKSIRLMAQAGFEPEFVAQVHHFRNETRKGCDPVQQAIRTGRAVIFPKNRIKTCHTFWSEDAHRRGSGAVLALPLKHTKIFGVLTIYAAQSDAFVDDAVSLLTGLANDLACGIFNLRALAEQRRAEEALKESEKELRLLTVQLLRMQESERRRVARELHDELGQALTVLKIHLVGIEENLLADQLRVRASCEEMLSYIDTVIEHVRRLAWDLCPSCLEDLGLSSSLGYLVEEICRNHNLTSSMAMDEIDHLFSPETQINIYRIFQEALANIATHASATQVSVRVQREDQKVSFVLRDNGQGFNLMEVMSGQAAKRSLGLTAMHERALMAQGSLQISSRKDQGTTITFSIPTVNSGK